MWQLILNSLASGVLFAMLAVSFALVYRISRFFHVAHGAVLTVGAYGCYFTSQAGFPLVTSIISGMFTAAIMGALLDMLVHRPLRFRQTSGSVHLIASLGLYALLENSLAIVFGDASLVLRFSLKSLNTSLFGAHLNGAQMMALFLAPISIVALIAFVRVTSWGQSYRAVSCDSQLARITGVKSERIILIFFVIASAVAGLVGVLIALDVGIAPAMGMRILMPAVAAALLGGAGRLCAVVCAAFAVVLLQNMAVMLVASVWQDAIAFIILIVAIVVANLRNRNTYAEVMA